MECEMFSDACRGSPSVQIARDDSARKEVEHRPFGVVGLLQVGENLYGGSVERDTDNASCLNLGFDKNIAAVVAAYMLPPESLDVGEAESCMAGEKECLTRFEMWAGCGFEFREVLHREECPFWRGEPGNECRDGRHRVLC